MLSYKETSIQEIVDPLLVSRRVRLLVKREDMNNPFVSGNKWWKLKYNLETAIQNKYQTVLTFGGAYSNHIYATAAAANELGLGSIGVIRGEETLPLNATLSFATANGMKLHYLSRELYRNKHEDTFLQQLIEQHGDFYMIPEGGTNSLAIKGVREFGESILEAPFDYLCCPVGTGGTLSGLIEACGGPRKIIGFSVLKGGEFLKKDIQNNLESNGLDTKNWKLETDYHFGGYGRVTKELLEFIERFKTMHGILLDPIYTGKMMAGIYDMIDEQKFPKDSVILAIHTGGLQGWDGINQRFSESIP